MLYSPGIAETVGLGNGKVPEIRTFSFFGWDSWTEENRSKVLTSAETIEKDQSVDCSNFHPIKNQQFTGYRPPANRKMPRLKLVPQPRNLSSVFRPSKMFRYDFYIFNWDAWLLTVIVRLQNYLRANIRWKIQQGGGVFSPSIKKSPSLSRFWFLFENRHF